MVELQIEAGCHCRTFGRNLTCRAETTSSTIECGRGTLICDGRCRMASGLADPKPHRARMAMARSSIDDRAMIASDCRPARPAQDDLTQACIITRVRVHPSVDQVQRGQSLRERYDMLNESGMVSGPALFPHRLAVGVILNSSAQSIKTGDGSSTLPSCQLGDGLGVNWCAAD